MDSLQEALIAIEKLRDYHPKFTPRHVYGSGSRKLFPEKEHSNPSNRASRDVTLPSSRSLLDRGPDHNDGVDGDIEDGDRTVVGTLGGENTIGWKGKGKRKDQLSRTETRDRKYHRQGTLGFNAKEDTETYPSGSRPPSPSGITPFAEHRYPPTLRYGSPRASVDGSHEGGDTLAQAAKAIKSVVLHDARNIKGKSEGLASAAWNVNSAHEAKVRSQ